MAEEAHYLVLIRGSKSKDVYIMATDDGCINGFETERKVKDYFLRSYESAHYRSYEGSMSACVHFIQFQPRYIRFENLEEVKNNIAAEKPHFMSLRSVAGLMYGITCRPEAYKLWEEAQAVPLIKEPK